MRNYLHRHPEQKGSFSPDELDMLDALVKRAMEAVHIADPAEHNEVAARILSIYSLGGRSADEILEIAVRLHKQGYAPGGRRSNGPAPKRIRTERQR
ncbi:hypothetical protein [Pseudaminobacter soli (ex Li et al. 2025)]|uniref:Uncharacterized protein n=1 Tax=Pseudaminobacter soli (ex Li et al. 2025) TaxID=1295366 RepID=A0A2P7RSP3_9HYPH|nr:hypothetical protein [Mesorhizobium soli]PSJ53225.1 hypothetical protein C7I85_28345 [Mesorhizobium soli]